MRKQRQRISDNGTFAETCTGLLDDFAQQRPIRTGSLVISVFGDAIAPHGGSVWLGSIITALESFGISDRLVRTSVFRLVRKGWLDSERIGRRSFYRFTDKGFRRFQEASRRIYSEPRQEWTGAWCLALLAGVDSTSRDDIRRELGWLGFASFSSNVLAHPSPDLAAVDECLADIDGGDRALVMEARPYDGETPYLQTLVRDAWQLEGLDSRYAEFLERFRPVYLAARDEPEPDPRLAFCARILLIHAYRRILLRDPFLPHALLPERWNGSAAYQLCRNLYAKLAPPAEHFLTGHIENEYGPLPPAEPGFYRRFGGHSDAQRGRTREPVPMDVHDAP